MSAFGLGHIAEPEGQFRWPFALHGASRLVGADLPATVMLDACAPPVFNQLSSGSCVAHAYVTAAYTRMAAAKTPLPFLPDPLTLYRFTREVQRAWGISPAGALEDNGSMPMIAMQAAERWGLVRFIPWDMADVNQEAAVLDVEDAASLRLTGASALNPLSATPLATQARQALAAEIPVTLATQVTADFDSYKSGTLPAPSGPSRGSHYVAMLGFVEDADGLRFLLRNSWGPSWGQQGDAWVSAAFVNAAVDLYAVTVTRAA
jgi:hypothetical protein